MAVNDLDQPIGEPVPGWEPRPRIAPVTLSGRSCRLEPLGEQHADDLYAALVTDSPDSLWTYLFADPFTDPVTGRSDFEAYLATVIDNRTFVPMAVVVDGRALGHECFMRIEPAHGVAEVGNIALGSALQATTAATETAYLMMRHVFDDLCYRRYEWKCDALNAPSRAAAERFGFTFEGIFRQAVVYKQRSRDTAWFAVTDADWPRLRTAYETWLDPANFDDAGRQRSSLRELTPSHHPGAMSGCWDGWETSLTGHDPDGNVEPCV